MVGKQPSQVEQDRLLAENALLLADSSLNELLTGMCRYTFTDKDNKLGGGVGAEYTGAIPKYIAAKMALTSLFRTSWISESEARVAIWSLHRHFNKIKTLLTEEELEEGGSLVMDMGYEVAKFNVLSAINGRMSKLVKSSPHSVEVQVGNITGGKEKR